VVEPGGAPPCWPTGERIARSWNPPVERGAYSPGGGRCASRCGARRDGGRVRDRRGSRHRPEDRGRLFRPFSRLHDRKLTGIEGFGSACPSASASSARTAVTRLCSAPGRVDLQLHLPLFGPSPSPARPALVVREDSLTRREIRRVARGSASPSTRPRTAVEAVESRCACGRRRSSSTASCRACARRRWPSACAQADDAEGAARPPRPGEGPGRAALSASAGPPLRLYNGCGGGSSASARPLRATLREVSKRPAGRSRREGGLVTVVATEGSTPQRPGRACWSTRRPDRRQRAGLPRAEMTWRPGSDRGRGAALPTTHSEAGGGGLVSEEDAGVHSSPSRARRCCPVRRGTRRAALGVWRSVRLRIELATIGSSSRTAGASGGDLIVIDDFAAAGEDDPGRHVRVW